VGAGSGRRQLPRARLAKASNPPRLVRSARFWLVSFGTIFARAFHEIGRQYRDGGGPCRRIDVSGHGGKTCKVAKAEDVRRLRAPERPLYFRLRSIELVHDEHLHKRPVDTGTVLALLRAERLMPRPALLRNRTCDAYPQCPFGA
jgi:hypothetical protein